LPDDAVDLAVAEPCGNEGDLNFKMHSRLHTVVFYPWKT